MQLSSGSWAGGAPKDIDQWAVHHPRLGPALWCVGWDVTMYHTAEVTADPAIIYLLSTSQSPFMARRFASMRILWVFVELFMFLFKVLVAIGPQSQHRRTIAHPKCRVLIMNSMLSVNFLRGWVTRKRGTVKQGTAPWNKQSSHQFLWFRRSSGLMLLFEVLNPFRPRFWSSWHVVGPVWHSWLSQASQHCAVGCAVSLSGPWVHTLKTANSWPPAFGNALNKAGFVDNVPIPTHHMQSINRILLHISTPAARSTQRVKDWSSCHTGEFGLAQPWVQFAAGSDGTRRRSRLCFDVVRRPAENQPIYVGDPVLKHVCYIDRQLFPAGSWSWGRKEGWSVETFMIQGLATQTGWLEHVDWQLRWERMRPTHGKLPLPPSMEHRQVHASPLFTIGWRLIFSKMRLKGNACVREND